MPVFKITGELCVCVCIYIKTDRTFGGQPLPTHPHRPSSVYIKNIKKSRLYPQPDKTAYASVFLHTLNIHKWSPLPFRKLTHRLQRSSSVSLTERRLQRSSSVSLTERLKSFISWSVNAWSHLFHGQWTPEVIYFMVLRKKKKKKNIAKTTK